MRKTGWTPSIVPLATIRMFISCWTIWAAARAGARRTPKTTDLETVIVDLLDAQQQRLLPTGLPTVTRAAALSDAGDGAVWKPDGSFNVAEAILDNQAFVSVLRVVLRDGHAGHVSLEQLKVMSAIESCRTAALGGHVARCEDCAYA
jgi:hypothetical protein